jgi:hypothetical protein
MEGNGIDLLASAATLAVVQFLRYSLVLAQPDRALLNRQTAPVEKNLDIAFTAADNALGRARTMGASEDNE